MAWLAWWRSVGVASDLCRETRMVCSVWMSGCEDVSSLRKELPIVAPPVASGTVTVSSRARFCASRLESSEVGEPL